MNKKRNYIFLLVIVFVFSINSALAISPHSWESCMEALGEGGLIDCRVEGENWLPHKDKLLGLQQNMLLDEDNDGNVSLELRITNRHNYDLNKVTLSIEKCSGEVRFDNIKPGSAVYVKMGDICIYDYKRDFFQSKSLFTYLDENGNLKSYNGLFRFPVYKEVGLKEKIFVITLVVVCLLLIGFFVFLWLIKIKRFKK